MRKTIRGNLAAEVTGKERRAEIGSMVKAVAAERLCIAISGLAVGLQRFASGDLRSGYERFWVRVCV